MRRWMLGLLVMACGPTAGEPADDPSGTGTGDGQPEDTTGGGVTSDDGLLDSSSGVAEMCTPGQTRCASEAELETCGQDGQSWAAMVCELAPGCIPCGEGEDCEQARCADLCDAAPGGSMGCDFVLRRMLTPLDELDDAVIVVNPSADEPANVALVRVAQGTSDEVLVEEIVLEPGQRIDWTNAEGHVTGGSIYTTGGFLRVRSDRPVSVTHHGPQTVASANESSLVFPTETAGTEYIALSYSPADAGIESVVTPSYFEVVPLHPNTTVEWTPPVATAGAGAVPEVAAGATGSTAMATHDVLRVGADMQPGRMSVAERDLSGTVIVATQPVWVASGTRCARVPVGEAVGFCDSLYEVLMPLSIWTSTSIAAAPPPRDNERHRWRIYGGNDGPTAFETVPSILDADNCPAPANFDAGVCTLAQRGDWIELDVGADEGFVVQGASADDRLMAVGYTESRKVPSNEDAEGTSLGDAAMYQTVPPERWLTRYPLPSAGFANETVQITRHAGGATVFVNGAGVTGWTALGEYESANVAISGDSEVQSTEPFAATQFGYSDDTPMPDVCAAGACASGYAHPAGFGVAPAND